MLTRKGHMDLMCHKRSLQNEIASLDSKGATGLEEHDAHSMLDDFSWEPVLERHRHHSPPDSQEYAYSSSGSRENGAPSTKRIARPSSTIFQHKLEADSSHDLPRHKTASDTPVEPAYHFMLDTDFVFELGDRVEPSEKASYQSDIRNEHSKQSEKNRPVHHSVLDTSLSDPDRAHTVHPNGPQLGKDHQSPTTVEAGGQKKVPHPWFGKTDDPNGVQAGAAASNETLSGQSSETSAAPKPSFDPTLDPRDFSFNAERASKEEPQNTWTPTGESVPPETASRTLRKYVERVSTKQVLVPLILIVAGIVLLYPSNPKPYSVETRLFFITLDGKAPERAGWSVDREIKHFNNTNILYACAQKFFGAHQDSNSAPGNVKPKASIPSGAASSRTLADGRERFRSSGDFIKWFVKSSSLEADGSAVPSRITLRLAGHDPAFLKAVSESYVRSYVDFRRTIQSTDAADPKSEKAGRHNSDDASVKDVSDRMRNFEIQEREYELALRLLDSGKSPFSGFIPKDSMVDPGSLVNFQQKIVQLEINKNSLLTRFAPESREVRSVDEEIQSVREAMRQCVIEQLRFVKQSKEMLLAQKSGPEKASSEAVETKSSSSPPVAGRLGTINRDQPIFIADGLYLLWDTASVVDKPFFAKVGDFLKDRMVGNVYQSVENVKGLKDSVVTGIYHSLVSEDSFRGEAAAPSDLEDTPVETSPVRRLQNGR